MITHLKFNQIKEWRWEVLHAILLKAQVCFALQKYFLGKTLVKYKAILIPKLHLIMTQDFYFYVPINAGKLS